jgi:hypothetical protein
MRGVGAFHAELSENNQQWLLSSCDDHLTLHKDKLVQAPISYPKVTVSNSEM